MMARHTSARPVLCRGARRERGSVRRPVHRGARPVRRRGPRRAGARRASALG